MEGLAGGQAGTQAGGRAGRQAGRLLLTCLLFSACFCQVSLPRHSAYSACSTSAMPAFQPLITIAHVSCCNPLACSTTMHALWMATALRA